MAKYFIINSTTQNVANLPLIAQLMCENDKALVLESELSKKLTDNLIQLLKNRKIELVRRALITDTPVEIFETVKTLLNEICDQDSELIFIANGGSKLAFHGICEAIKNYSHKIYYGSQKPIYNLFENGLYSSTATHHFDRPNFTVEEIFQLNGFDYILSNQEQGKQVWPTFETFASGAGQYGKNSEYTLGVHNFYYINEFLKDSDVNGNKKDQLQHPRFEDVQPLFPDFSPVWLGQISHTIKELNKLFNEGLTEPVEIDKILFECIYNKIITSGFVDPVIYGTRTEQLQENSPNQLKNFCNGIFNALYQQISRQYPANTLHIIKSKKKTIVSKSIVQRVFDQSFKAFANTRKWLLSQMEETRAYYMNASLGFRYEDAVCERVLEYFKRNENTLSQVIHSVHTGIKAFRNNRVASEYDILIVTNNALLIHLECKSFTTDVKQMNANFAQLISNSSNLSSLFICAPLYTNASEQSWFERVLSNKELFKDVPRINFIPFTLEDQSNTFINSKGECTEIESFESSLDNLFKRLL